MFYTKNAIPKSGVFSIKIKIIDTYAGMIAFGIMPENKKNQDCVYCDSSQIIYFYCRNRQIYNGQLLGLINSSKKTYINEKIKNGDIIKMLIDNNVRSISWYVNDKYAGY